MSVKHKFNVGDRVVFTNDFGVCWGVKSITSLEARPTTRHDDGPHTPGYHYEGTDTPWFATDEKNFVLADDYDLLAEWYGEDEYFQDKHGFTPTLEQLGGCY